MNDFGPVASSDENSITELAADIVSAYVSKNPVSTTDLPTLIRSVHVALKQLGTPTIEAEPELLPAVSIKRSVAPDYLVCLDDGKKFKSMRRHLSQLGMTPEQYREKWNLPADYPMVAPNYSATRSKLALSNGLGRKPTEPELAVAEPAQAEVAVIEPVKPKYRRKATVATTE